MIPPTHTLFDYNREVRRLAPKVNIPEDWVDVYYHQGWSPETAAKFLTSVQQNWTTKMRTKIISTLLLLCLATPAFSADLNCVIFKTPNNEKILVCKEDVPAEHTKSIAPIILKYVVIPLVETATEEIIKRVHDAYVAKYGAQPGKIHLPK